MVAADSGYVLQNPESLSARAQAFLRSCSRRESVDRGLTGDELDAKIREVYGRPNEQTVALLEAVQTRYGGLAYRSGYFGEDVSFSPVCEPETAEEALEILYAVHTGGPAGASLTSDGTVMVGLDAVSVAEFPSLDAVIECDSMFRLAEALPVAKSSYADRRRFADAVARLSANSLAPLYLVPEACGTRTYWFCNDSAMVFLCGTWSELSFMPPLFKVWGTEASVIEKIDQLVAQLWSPDP